MAELSARLREELQRQIKLDFIVEHARTEQKCVAKALKEIEDRRVCDAGREVAGPRRPKYQAEAERLQHEIEEVTKDGAPRLPKWNGESPSSRPRRLPLPGGVDRRQLGGIAKLAASTP